MRYLRDVRHLLQARAQSPATQEPGPLQAEAMEVYGLSEDVWYEVHPKESYPDYSRGSAWD